MDINGNIKTNIMIEGNKIIKNEQDYRNTPVDSASSLKIFSLDRRKYYKIFIEKVKEDDEDTNKAMIIGSLVDCLLLSSSDFDFKFHMSACASTPTGLMEKFVEALYKYTRNATNEEGIVMREFKDILKMLIWRVDLKLNMKL